MAYSVTTQPIGTIAAGADLSAKQFYAVQLSSGAAIVPTVAGQRVFALLQNAPTSGQACELVTAPGMIGKGWLGGTVTVDDELTVTSAGKLVTSTTPGDHIIGTALESGTDGKVVAVMIDRRVRAPFSYSFDVVLALIADGDIVTAFTPGHRGVITKFFATATTKASTAAKLSTLNIEIGTTNTTGGTIALTTAGLDTLGKVVESSAFTAANVFTATDTLSIEASSTTTFIEGRAMLTICGYVP